MFEVSVEETFAAGHALREYKGKCENVHGHNYRVRVTIEGAELSRIGLLVDFGDIKKILRESISYLDHRFLNDLPPFDVWNPSAENMARFFYEEMAKGLPGRTGDNEAGPDLRVKEVLVWETDRAWATYRPQ